jgi:hypothetical protein
MSDDEGSRVGLGGFNSSSGSTMMMTSFHEETVAEAHLMKLGWKKGEGLGRKKGV